MKISQVAFAVSTGLACCIGNINVSSATSIDSNIKISGVYSAHSFTADSGVCNRGLDTTEIQDWWDTSTGDWGDTCSCESDLEHLS
ncbi:hypothetical protein BM527_03515 [Alteromonas sp. Mex14]|nr:hypothetical protein BM527_03515 [Alteromonas sp. Mex14]